MVGMLLGASALGGPLPDDCGAGSGSSLGGSSVCGSAEGASSHASKHTPDSEQYSSSAQVPQLPPQPSSPQPRPLHSGTQATGGWQQWKEPVHPQLSLVSAQSTTTRSPSEQYVSTLPSHLPESGTPAHDG